MDTGCVEIHLANPAHREIIIDDSQVLRQPSIIFVIFHRFWFNLFPFADILSFAPSSIILDYFGKIRLNFNNLFTVDLFVVDLENTKIEVPSQIG